MYWLRHKCDKLLTTLDAAEKTLREAEKKIYIARTFDSVGYILTRMEEAHTDLRDFLNLQEPT